MIFKKNIIYYFYVYIILYYYRLVRNIGILYLQTPVLDIQLMAATATLVPRVGVSACWRVGVLARRRYRAFAHRRSQAMPVLILQTPILPPHTLNLR